MKIFYFFVIMLRETRKSRERVGFKEPLSCPVVGLVWCVVLGHPHRGTQLKANEHPNRF